MASRSPTRLQIAAALQLFGLVDAFRIVKSAIHQTIDMQAAEAIWASFQLRVDKVYREMAMAAHPDLGGEVDKMQALNAAKDILKQLKVHPPRRRRPPRMVVRVVVRRPAG